jgi:hypothetical protein
MPPMVQCLMWTREVGMSELALIEVASRGRTTTRCASSPPAGDSRRYADAVPAVERCIDDLGRGDRPPVT